MRPVRATAEGTRAEHLVVPMPAERGVARLSLDNGASHLRLRTAGSGVHLARGRFAGTPPLVWTVDATVHLEYPPGARPRRRSSGDLLELSTLPSWSVDVHGATDRFDAEFAGADLRSLAFYSGLAHARIALGRPRGRCTVRFSSVDKVLVTRPRDVPVRIEAVGDVGQVLLDDRPAGAAGGRRHRSPGYERALDRYLILISAAASSLTIGAPSPRPGHRPGRPAGDGTPWHGGNPS